MPLLPTDCAGRPGPLCGRPVDVFGDHAVSCKKSGFGDGHLGIQTSLCQVINPSRVPADREVDIVGNGRFPAYILLKAWDGSRDLAVDLTIVQPDPIAGRPLRGSAATFLKDNDEQEFREIADCCGRMDVEFSNMVFDSRWGGSTGQGRSLRRLCSPDAPPRSIPAPAQRQPVPCGRASACNWAARWPGSWRPR